MAQMKRATRVPFDEEVRYQVEGRSFCDRAANLSLSGIFIRTTRTLPIDAEVLLEFDLALADRRHPLQLRGKIYRTVSEQEVGPSPPGLGITFIQLHPTARELLSDWVRESAARGELSPPPLRAKPAAALLHALPRTGPAATWEAMLPHALLGVLIVVLLYVLWHVV